MNKELIIEKTVRAINDLPESRAEEISDFADFVIKKYEEHKLSTDVQKMVSESRSFNFLENEEDIYSLEDLKEVYNA
jgi:hypothetical protein